MSQDEAEVMIGRWLAGECLPTPIEFDALRKAVGDEDFYKHFGDLAIPLPGEEDDCV